MCGELGLRTLAELGLRQIIFYKIWDLEKDRNV